MSATITKRLLLLIVDRYEKNETLTKICSDLNLKQSTISRALKRHGLVLQKKTFISDNQLIKAKKLYSSGKSQQETADILGVKRSSLARKLRSIKYEMRSRNEVLKVRKFNRSIILKAHKNYLKTGNTSQISESLGITKSGLLDNFKHHNLEIKKWKKFDVKYINKINLEISDGFTLNELSKKYQFSVSGFRQAASRLNIEIITSKRSTDNTIKQQREKTNYIKYIQNLTKKQISDILKYYQNAYSITDISDMVGISNKQIIICLNKHKIEISPNTNVTDVQIKLIYEQSIKEKVSISTLAKNCGLSVSTVNGRIKKLSLHKTQYHTKKQISDILKYYQNAYSITDISDMVGISNKQIIICLNNHNIKVAPKTDFTDVQVKLIHERRTKEKIGISTLAKEYGISPSTIYQRLKKFDLDVDRSMGTSSLVYSDQMVKELYEEARRRKCSLSQLVRDRGLNENFGSIMNVGRKLGLKPLEPHEITGHNSRELKLYLLKVKNGEKVGIYAGSSIDPEERVKQHLSTGKKNIGVNKRDAFINEAYLNAVKNKLELFEWFSFEVLPGSYTLKETEKAEPKLIKKTIKKYNNILGIKVLNGLVGAPIGGYGKKLDKGADKKIIELYKRGLNTTQIATEMKVSRATINRLIQRTGNQKTRKQYLSKFSQKERDQAYSMYKSGISKNQISKTLKMSSSTVKKIIFSVENEFTK